MEMQLLIKWLSQVRKMHERQPFLLYNCIFHGLAKGVHSEDIISSASFRAKHDTSFVRSTDFAQMLLTAFLSNISTLRRAFFNDIHHDGWVIYAVGIFLGKCYS